jgi:soluble lytic murein transglycosylase-like protein
LVKTKILLGLLLAASCLLMVGRWGGPPETPEEEPLASAPLCAPSASGLRDSVEALLHKALVQSGQRWPRAAFQSAVEGVVDVVNRHHYPAPFVFSLIQAESSFQLAAVSPQGAVGLTQLLPATARSMAPLLEIPLTDSAQLFDPGTNIRLGFGYLASLQETYGTLDAALAVYNGGPAVVRAGQAAPLPLAGYRKGIYEGETQFAQWLKSP